VGGLWRGETWASLIPPHTPPPHPLPQLAASTEPVEARLSKQAAAEACTEPRVVFDEASFRFALNEDAMATEKLAEGIRGFCADIRKLEDYLRPLMKK